MLSKTTFKFREKPCYWKFFFLVNFKVTWFLWRTFRDQVWLFAKSVKRSRNWILRKLVLRWKKEGTIHRLDYFILTHFLLLFIFLTSTERKIFYTCILHDIMQIHSHDYFALTFVYKEKFMAEDYIKNIGRKRVCITKWTKQKQSRM